MLSTATQAAQLLVLRDERACGAYTMGELAGFLPSFGDPTAPGGLVGAWPIEEALNRCYEVDAHFVQYSVFDKEGPQPRWTRINKSCVEELAVNGFEVKATVLGIDLDTNPRKPWSTDGTSPDARVLIPPLMAALSANPLTASWYAVYMTNKGLRVLYRLKEPVSVLVFEPLACGMLAIITKTRAPDADESFKLDWSCTDWTRLFRLPRVVRAGEPTYSAQVVIRENERLDLMAVQPDVKPSLAIAAHAQRYVGTCPAIDEVEINFSEGGSWVEWKKVALRALAGTESGLVAAGRKQLVEGDGQRPSGRNDAIHEHVGQAIGRLYPLSLDVESQTKQLTSPETIYGLFLPAVQQFAPDETSKMSWPMTLWDAVTRIWAKESAKQRMVWQQKKQEEETKAVAEMTAVQRLLHGFSSWCSDPRYTKLATDSDKAGYILRRLVATPGGQNYFCLQNDGHYSPYACSKETLVAHATSDRVGMHFLIDFEKQTEGKDGKVKIVRLAAQELIDKHAVIVHSIKGGPKKPGVLGGTLIQNGDFVKLSLALLEIRTDLDPTYSSEVQAWLESFGRPELIDYIAKALDLELVMPILSLAGATSAGKAMLVRGLVECTPAETVASDRDFGTFSPKFIETPFLSVNEGVESGGGTKEISAIVRHLTGGEPIEVNRKHKTPMDMDNNLRIIVSANNDNVVAQLLGQGSDLTVDDKEALLMRLVHLDVDKAPADFLRKLGGRDYTGREGAKWIRGTNRVCDYIVAKHFLWLNKNWKRMPTSKGARFAMNGLVPARLMQEMNLGGGTTPVIIENLLRFVESPASNTARGILLAPPKWPDRVLVTAAAIMDFYRTTDEGRKNAQKLNVNSIGKVLKTLRIPGTATESREFKNNLGMAEKTRWWDISLETLLTEAESHGYKCERAKAAYEAWKTTQKAS